MASRVLVRRRSCIVDYARSYARSPHCLQILCHGQSTQHLDSPNVPNVGLGSPVDQNSQYTNSLNTVNRGVGPREDLINFSALGLYRSNNYGSFSPIKPDFGRSYASSMSLLRDLQSLRHASTATAGQPRYDDEEKEVAAEKKKQASPEECDQAVVGLNTAKAKVKSKLQDSQSTEKSLLLQRMWTKVLGIGPTLRVVASMNREDWAKKLVHMKKHAVSTFKEYWLGTKLLWANVRISFRLLEKLAGGKSLSRRERQLFMRTTIDIFRLVPLAVFLIVPFMEFLLPVALTIFPNMLPSTFKNKMKEQEQLKRKLNARIEYAKFLQDTAKQMAKEVQHSRIGEMKQTAEDLDELLNKVRKGSRVSNDEILAFAKLFNDELTLDNISRPRLVNMCKYMAISPYGTDAYLRYMLRQRLRRIKEDDKMIQAEGIESLSEAELREDCRERGMLGLTSVQEMRQQLRDWLDLSLNHSVPSSLLILSRAFMVSGKVRPEDAVQATLSSLPDEVVETVSVTSLPSEDSVSERRRKLEFLEKEEELIKEEEEDREEEQARLKESIVNEEDVALKEMTNATAKEVHERAIAKAMEKHENFCELSRALAVLASASSVSREREEFLRLVTDEIELYNSMVEKEGTEGEADAFKAYKAAREESEDAAEPAVGDNVTDALRDRIDGMLHTLEKEIDDVDAKIGDGWRLLDRDFDGKVTPEEVAAATMYLKDTLGKEGEGIQELISSLSKDRDGKILVEDIVKLARRSEDEDSPDDRVNH